MIVDLLRKFSLTEKQIFKLYKPKEEVFKSLESLVTKGMDKNIFGKNKQPYFGTLNLKEFNLRENKKLWGFSKASDSRIIGTFEEDNTLSVESYLFESREIIFTIVGSVMTLVGTITLLTTLNIQSENALLIPFGISWLLFTFFYMKQEAKKGMKNFERRLAEIQRTSPPI